MPLFPVDSHFSDDQRLLVETVRRFAAEELYSLDRMWDQGESSVASILDRLSEMGLLNLSMPEALNGLNATSQLFCAILHELAMWSPSTCVTVAVHNMVGMLLYRAAREPFRSHYLAEWSAPSNFAAFALSEAGAGSDPGASKTTARKTDDGYRITGEKMWITNGLHARWFVVLARLESTVGRNGLCIFLVDGNERGLQRTPIHGKMGIRGSETAVISLDDVFVSSECLLGEPGGGLRGFLMTLNSEGRVDIAAQATGIAEACLNEMTSYARQREQFGQPIGNFQAVADMVANSAVDLDAARALLQRAAYSIDHGEADRSLTSMAKLFATEAANRIAYRAVQIHGGSGYVNECRVEQLFRDARVTTIYEGTSEIQRLIISRGLGAFG